MNAPTLQTTNGSEMMRGIINRGLQLVVVLFVEAVILLSAAGRLDWLWAWVYLGAYTVLIGVNAFLLLRKDPELIVERGKIRDDAQSWDKVLATLASLVGPFVVLIVSGLDERWNWSPELNLTVRLIALVGMILAFLLVSWAMLSNPFFSGTVRIQKERGHTVAASGPYRYVRHPGYVGMSFMWVLPALLLGSLWGLVPALVTVALIVVRTALEDRMLQNELEGYREYAQRVRYRLVPGVW
ncbi:MAG: isoprenylcysteine carboxylmethyltransferase family protein [Anaerolineae bacterium]